MRNDPPPAKVYSGVIVAEVGRARIRIEGAVDAENLRLVPEPWAGDETTVVKMHSGKEKHDEMDRRAIACFDQALADVGLANDATLRQVLHDYFAWATTTTMSRYHRLAEDVPNGLAIPHWSWDGLKW